MASFTLSSLQTSFQNLKRDISDVPQATYIEWCQYILDYVYERLAAEDSEQFLTTATITALSGTSNYALPADFLSHTEFGAGLFETDGTGLITNNKLSWTESGSSDIGYFISGSNFVLTPTPTATRTIKDRYIPVAPTFSALTDYFTLNKTSTGVEIIGNQFRNYCVKALDVFYTQWDEDVSAESWADQRWMNVLNDMLTRFKRGPKVYMTKSGNAA